MSFRRLLSAVRTARETLTRGAPVADNLLKSLISIVVICFIALSSPPSASAKPFAPFSSWTLSRLVDSFNSRAEEVELREPQAGAKPYTGRRVGNDTLRMIYFHDQTVAVVELGPGKLLLNCELIETYGEGDTARLARQLSHINQPLGVSFPQMLRLMSQCQQVEGVEALEDSRSAEKESREWRLADLPTKRPANTRLLANGPLTLLQGIIPSTKWCGTGDIAADYHDLGEDRRLDRCCRTHDLCPAKVRAFSTRYNLTNNSIYSKSHCKCDDLFFDCLKTTNTSAAHLMGNIYFNLVQVPCLEDTRHGRHFRDAKEGF